MSESPPSRPPRSRAHPIAGLWHALQAELDDLHYRSPSSKHYPYQRRFGVLCDFKLLGSRFSLRYVALWRLAARPGRWVMGATPGAHGGCLLRRPRDLASEGPPVRRVAAV